MHISESITINASPDEVWKVAGDVANVSDWVPAISASRLEGDIRHATFADGSRARERIVEVDDKARSYVYEFLDGPLALESYTSTLAVRSAEGGSSLVTWDADLSAANDEVERGLFAAISGIYSSALSELSNQVSR
jgi:carbon monoxide dehydrogenase subunit G